MNRDKHREIEQQRRHDCRRDNLEVGHPENFGHDEGGRPHDRRRDLPAGGGNGFHRRRKSRRIAETLHHRNGEVPGGCHIGDRRAGNHAEQAARNGRYLGCSARLASTDTHGEVHEALTAAGMQ